MPITPIRPVASPVQRFVTPAQAARASETIGETKATQLARALSSFAQSAIPALEHRRDRIDNEQVELARAQRTQTALNYKEAIKQGIITADQSPFFVQSWKEQDGRVAADRYNADLIIALSTGPFSQSTDHAETEPLLNTFRSNWMKQNGVQGGDRDFMDGFAAKAQAYESTVRQHQASAVGQRIIDQTTNNTFHEVLGVFDEASFRDLSASSTADGIDSITSRGVLVGMDPKDVNRIVLDAAIAKAVETNSIQPFLILDQVKTGSGTLGRTKEALLARQSIEAQIADKTITRDRWAHEKLIQERAETELSASKNIFDTFLNNKLRGLPTTVDEVASELHRLGSVDAARAESMMKLVIESGKPSIQYDDPAVNRDLYNARITGTLTQSQINASFLSHLITVETAKDLTDYLHARQREELGDAHAARREGIADARYAQEQARINRPKDITQLPSWRVAEDSIRKSFGDEPGVQMDASKANRLNEAIFRGRMMFDEWWRGTPTATQEDQYKKSSEIYKLMLDSYGDTSFAVKPGATVNDTLKDTPGAKQFGLVEQPVNILTTPQQPPSAQASTRHFPSAKAWEDALDAYSADPVNSALAKLMRQFGFTTAVQKKQFLSTQGALY
jgi:hypothetical protein